MVVILNIYKIDSNLNDKIISNLILLLADTQEYLNNFAFPAAEILRINIS
jgi:hypothetical protein